MSKIQSLALIILSFAVLACSGLMFIETYEDHIQRLFFANFTYSGIIYYKLNFSFWPEVFCTLNNLSGNIPWYEVFLSAINIISLFLCLRVLKNNWFAIAIFVLVILMPQFIFLNYTRVTIFAAAIAAIGVLQSERKRYAIGYLILLLTAASIRWQLTAYTILIVLLLYLNGINVKRVWWMAFVAIIPIYMYFQNTSPKQEPFYKTESYIFSLNDSKNSKPILETDSQLMLIKEMATRFIIPERKFINEHTLSQITYKTFYSPNAMISNVKNFSHKAILIFRNKPLIPLFTILSLCVLYFLGVAQYENKHIVRISLAFALIVVVIILIKAAFYVIYPSLSILVLYAIENDFIREKRQKKWALVICVCVALANILYSLEVKKKILFSNETVSGVYSQIRQGNSIVIWDVQSVIVNFQPIFHTEKLKSQNYFLEEPYMNILSQVPNNNFKEYNDFYRYISNKSSIWVVDKERFMFINKYLKQFYNKEYSYSVIKEFPYNKEQKVNKIYNNIYESDTSILLVRVNGF